MMISDRIADRLGGSRFGKETTLYKFARIKQAKEEAKRLRPELPLIDMGVGEPDLPADPGIVAVLSEEAGKAENRWYADNGIFEFQQAAVEYLERVYQVKGLDPATQIIHGIGSKPILAMLPLGFINPGDVILATTPGYPIASTYTSYLGGEVFFLPLSKENNFYPDFSNIPAPILKRAKLLYINYPNNPTGQVATNSFYREVIEFAKRHHILVIADAAYAALTYDGTEPLSFLSVDGAMEVGVEVHSLSKAFNMTGWRLAFVAGNPEIVKVYGVIKDNTDSGQFRALQKAGIYALRHPEITIKNCGRYSHRLDRLVNLLKNVGFQAEKPKGSFYCYVPAPRGLQSGIRFTNAVEASEFLIREALISTVPWDDAGAYLRWSVTYEAEDESAENEIMDEMKLRLDRLGLIF